MNSVAAAVIERWFSPEFRAAYPKKVIQAQRMLENSPPEGYAASCAAIRDMDQCDSVGRINTQTLVIHGAKDPVTPLADAQFLVDQICGAASVELNAAHLSNVEQPETFTEAVISFLSR